tara:strand:+ start:2981 stop:3223 length:243 start_codon:yes stop_codon:yes gene_type:complete
MTGFESKRKAAQAKLDDEADTLLIVYQRGYADGKQAAQRKPLTTGEIDLLAGKNQNNDGTFSYLLFARAIEQAHGIKEQP